MLIRGEEENGFTILEFWRNYSSCDDRDRDIGKVRARDDHDHCACAGMCYIIIIQCKTNTASIRNMLV